MGAFTANIVLNEGEQVLFESRFSLIKFLPRWAVSIGICVLMLSIAGNLRDRGSAYGWSPYTTQITSDMAAAVSIAAFLVFLVAFLLYRQQWLVLTESRLTITWLWNLRSENFVLRNLSNISKRRTLLGLLFGYGTLEVQNMDGQWVHFRFVPGVDRLEALLSQASMRQSPAASAVLPPVAGSASPKKR